jgi:GH25 family lysozyme M1 (1,4-beta-N-acetylmuramidase)
VLKSSAASAIADTFRAGIAAAGYRTGLYCSTGWIPFINQTVVDKFDSVWIAEWGSKCDYKGKYDIWQNGETPRVGPVVADLDIMYNDIIAPDGNDVAREILKHLESIDTSTDTIRQILKGLIK